MVTFGTDQKPNENGVRPPCGDTPPPVSPAREQPGDPSPASLVEVDWWRPLLGLTPHLPEGRDAWWALVPNRFRSESLEKMAPVHRGVSA
jgi:hypothetical protein